MKKLITVPSVLLFLALLPVASVVAAPTARPNVLFITADDMNHDTPGFTGGPVSGVTPHLDQLAAEGMWFARAHVTVAVCQPSRECLMTGRYPHHNGATGFYPVREDVPTLAELLKSAGYYIGILGKEIHLQPAAKFPWDFVRTEGELARGRDPAKYHQFTKEFIQQAKDSGKPFFLMANSHDPHRPFAGSENEGKLPYPQPDRIFTPEEIVVPSFLPDLPEVRKELAQYYSSARRCDQSLGEVLHALKDSGLEESTLVMFVSDNGIAMPFAKSNCYFTSTRTPWLVRWPGKVKPGRVDREDFISGIDFMPTVLEAAGLPLPAGMDGRSLMPLLAGETQSGRDHVFTCYNEAYGNKAYPMRCMQDKRFGYIFNAWADGKVRYNTEAMSGLTFKAMQNESARSSDVAARVEVLVHRTPEELYDYSIDPGALHNLIDDPAHRTRVEEMRQAMLKWMDQTQDPLLPRYRAALAQSGEKAADAPHPPSSPAETK